MTQKLSSDRLRRMADVLRRNVDAGDRPGIVALVAGGDDVHVECHGVQDTAKGAPMRRDTIFRVASLTKPVTAVAAMMLVEDATLRLDAPVDPWLPELASRRVLRTLESPLDDTVPANRPITVRDLLTMRGGFGAIMAMPGTYPIQDAIADAGLGPGALPPAMPPDEWLSRFSKLPLLHQPGERWMYDTGSLLLGVLVARASGMPLSRFFAERIFEPLAMADTGFYVPSEKMDRFAAAYSRDDSGALAVFDPAAGGAWSSPPAFESGSGGLVSTVDDYLTFGRMLLSQGRYGGKRLLSRVAVELMLTDHITTEQKAASPFFPGFWDTSGWGFGGGITTRRDGVGPSIGSYGWTGGLGTTWCIDPREGLVSMLFSQRLMTGPGDVGIYGDFFTLAYQAIED